MNYIAQRKHMVETQLAARGIKDERVLRVFLDQPRDLFISPDLIDSAYADRPLPIGSGQTISQPYMVALMTELLRLEGDETVLEIGTGSGYQTAILAALAKQVYTIERIERLAEQAKQRFEALAIKNVCTRIGDGTLGLVEFQPYDAIIVTAGAPQVPRALLDQLKDGGRLVIPVGDRSFQKIKLIEKKADKIIETEKCGCVFVPLIGEKGWEKNDYGSNR
jgi:protein-L-isoaspartate(D-aspartate) O-methyltransferase